MGECRVQNAEGRMWGERLREEGCQREEGCSQPDEKASKFPHERLRRASK